MKREIGQRYQPTEFARRAGVTVRALHFYDRLGLLKPSARTGAGYRLYGDGDFARLQQIVTFKFIGFPLKEIKRLLDRRGSDLAISLRAQRRTLQAKREQLGRALNAIARAEELLAERKSPGEQTFRKIIETIQMQTNTDWSTKYYNDEAARAIEERKGLWSPELQKETEEAYTNLYKDIEAAAARNIDPAGPDAQALVARQKKLVEGFTGGNAAISEGLTKMWKDQANWPDEVKKQIMEPFAKAGLPAMKGPQPSFLTEKAQAWWEKAGAAAERKN